MTNPSRFLFAATIFTSGFLLFIVQPLIARQILPWFGGSAGVWTTCLMFFQVALVGGYGYSNWTVKTLRPHAQGRLHLALLVASLISLPIVASAGWKPQGESDPTWRIIGLLLATIGLPYFVLCTTGPLLQGWFARAFPGRNVYRLFALSNLASLAALTAYPFAIEPWMSTTRQAQVWSIAYGVFVVLCGAVAWSTKRLEGAEAGRLGVAADDGAASAEPPSLRASQPCLLTRALWLALPAMGTWLLLAVTNHITQNIASIPFLWMVPLTLYLASFIIAFDHERWYQRLIWVIPAMTLLVCCAYGLTTDDVTLNVKVAVPLYSGGLFVWCLFCHGELAKLKPGPRDLTSYYLMIAAGGAIGGLLVGLVAPRVLPSYYELGIGLVVTSLLAAVVLRRQFYFAPSIAALAVAVACGYYSYQQIKEVHDGSRVLKRNFYGTLRTEDTGAVDEAGSKRQLINGVILHGEQFLAPDRRGEATSYYGPTAGISVALKLLDREGRHVGVIGLGAGSLAGYARTGDHISFYDINPQVVETANTEFTYLQDARARAAKVDINMGDARLSLEHQAPQGFDLLAVDAFSSDSIPIHLLTTEAVAVYERHMRPGGVIAFHVSNRFFDLAPVVTQLAQAHGLSSTLLIDNPDDPEFSKTDWVLVSSNSALLDDHAFDAIRADPSVIPKLRLWTDDDHNLFRIFKWD